MIVGMPFRLPFSCYIFPLLIGCPKTVRYNCKLRYHPFFPLKYGNKILGHPFAENTCEFLNGTEGFIYFVLPKYIIFIVFIRYFDIFVCFFFPID